MEERPKRRLAALRWLGLFAIVPVWGLAALHGFAGSTDEAWAQPSTMSTIPSAPVRVTIYGDSPGLSWSPDGTQLAYNQSFLTLYPTTPPPSIPREELGIFVVNTATGLATRVSEHAAFAPSWLDNGRLVYSCTADFPGRCDPGLFIVRLGAGVDKLDPTPAGAALAASSREVLYFNNYSWMWQTRDLNTQRTFTLPAPGGYADPSIPPPGRYLEQCQQNVGNIRAYNVTADGVYVAVGDHDPVSVSDGPPWSVTDVYGYVAETAPCLSPDGNRVAFLTPGSQYGEAVLNIVSVPR
jgi:hypothetical protein